MELELDHLARCRVPVTTQVADEPPRLARPARAVAVRDARRALDVLVGAHVVDERDEAVVEDREVEPEDLLGSGVRRAPGLHGAYLPRSAGPAQSGRAQARRSRSVHDKRRSSRPRTWRRVSSSVSL